MDPNKRWRRLFAALILLLVGVIWFLMGALLDTDAGVLTISALMAASTLIGALVTGYMLLSLR